MQIQRLRSVTLVLAVALCAAPAAAQQVEPIPELADVIAEASWSRGVVSSTEPSGAESGKDL